MVVLTGNVLVPYSSYIYLKPEEIAMKKQISKQRGLTIWGVIFIMAFIALITLLVVRAFPLYNTKMQVVSAMNSVASRPDATSLKESDVRKYFQRNIQSATNLDLFDDKYVRDRVHVEKASSKGGPRSLHVTFEMKNPLFQDIQLLMEFDEEIALRGPSGGE